MSERARDIVTPEGIPLTLRIADVGDRAAAFALDFVILASCWLLLRYLGEHSEGVRDQSSLLYGFTLLAMFCVRLGYFTVFEVRWHGSTPGKRIIGLRVVDRRGGPLRTDAVVVRNLMREVETFLPAQILLAPTLVFPGAKGGVVLVAALWVLVLVLVPVFNADRLRIGDVVAGTMVVRAPKAILLEDLGAAPATGSGGAAAPAARYTFSTPQLAVYGIYELQVLEDVLRQDHSLIEHAQTMDTVCDRIKTKIEWDRGHWDVDTERFLREFYAALRGRLEQDLLLGKRREDKFGKR